MPQWKSLVWKYFNRVREHEAECVICQGKISTRHGSTSSLRKHIIKLHPHDGQILLDGDRKRNSFKAGTSEITESADIQITVAENSNAPIKSETTFSEDDIACAYEKSSFIWKYMSMTEKKDEIQCQLCNKILLHRNSSTSNARKHLLRRHFGRGDIDVTTNLFQRPKLKKNILSVSKSKDLLSIGISNNVKRKNLDEKVVEMIALDLHPVSILESQGLLNLLSALNPNYIVPQLDVVTNELLPSVYKKIAGELFHKLKEISHVALTAEMWSGEGQELYLSVSAYFISMSDWTLKSAMLSTTAFIGIPLSKEIACELQRIAKEWNLSCKIAVMITDNETNTLLANEQLPWAYVPCFGHLLHLVVTNAISSDEEASALIQKVSSVVNFFQHNDEASENIQAKQKEMNLPEHKLVPNVPSRWNSNYPMLERMLEQVSAVNAVLEMHVMSTKRFTDEDIEMMRKIISSLKPFEIASLSLTSNESRSISAVLPLVKCLITLLTSLSDGKEPLTGNLKEGLISSFGKMEEIEWIMTATLLDPRFKKFPLGKSEAIEKGKANIISEVSALNEREQNMDDEGVCEENQPSASKNSSTTGCFWTYFEEVTNVESEAKTIQEAENSSALQEVQRYFKSVPVKRSDNPIFYWKQHEEVLPSLYKVATKYMSVPITAVSAERLFTKTGESFAKRVSQLKPKNVNMILFLNSNMVCQH